jgi:hypothetical protein
VYELEEAVKFVMEGRQQSVKVKYQPPAGGTPLKVT